VTAVFLTVAERFGKRTRSLEQLTWFDALWVGLFQAISIFPGI
ncbi:MAG: undecaprenyl-diphosphatase, partial [Acidobacteriia bacterium]|nr:undecaprenyl-diphosphatase [Terriglobia bacterium]